VVPALACVVAAAFGLTSCSGYDPIGVTLRSGVPAVEIVRCDKFETVALVDWDGNTLWRVQGHRLRVNLLHRLERRRRDRVRGRWRAAGFHDRSPVSPSR
jgi:hypothetical protein